MFTPTRRRKWATNWEGEREGGREEGREGGGEGGRERGREGRGGMEKEKGKIIEIKNFKGFVSRSWDSYTL